MSVDPAWIVAGLVASALAVAVGWGLGLRRRLAVLHALAASRGEGEGAPAERLEAALDAAARRVVEAEQRGVERERRLLRIADAAPNGWVVVDADGDIERLNVAALELLGLRAAPIGRSPLEGLHAPAVIDAIGHVQATGTAAAPTDFVHGARDLSVSAHPLEGGVLAVVRDVSDERALDRARTDFVANVSHELRTPIAAILGYAETVLDTPSLPPEVGRMGQALLRNARRLRALFDDLLTLYKLEARRRPPDTSPVDVGELVRLAVTTARDNAAAKGVTFEVFAEAGPVVPASPEALSTIVSNLAGNAVKYTPSGGTIVVRVEADDTEARVRVRDTGVGIARQHHARIFERFYRVDEGRSREAGGTGLGLAIVKHLADASGCRVTVDSQEGRGAEFTVHLRRPVGPRPRITWDVTLDPPETFRVPERP